MVSWSEYSSGFSSAPKYLPTKYFTASYTEELETYLQHTHTHTHAHTVHVQRRGTLTVVS